ncbi:MAG: DUF6160 family protein [Alcanivorax nanhaiticus]
MASKSLILLTSLPAISVALTPMDDYSLSAVNGQDGLTVNLESATGISVDNITWETDAGVANQAANTHFRDLSWEGDGGPMQSTYTLDVGSNASGVPMVAMNYSWEPGLYKLGGFTLETPSNASYQAHSLGELAVYSQGSLSLVNNGIFSTDPGNYAQLDFNMTGDMIVRQGGAGSAELSFGNLVFSNRFTNGPASGHSPGNGIVGVTPEGILIQAANTYTDLQFDLMYKENPTDFDRIGRSPMIHAGWTGGLANATMQILPGGVSYSATSNWDYMSNRSEGLLFLADWDFDTDFALVLGHADGDRTRLSLSDWTMMGGTSPGNTMLSMDVILDILQNNTGPAGLCMGYGLAAGQPTGAQCTANGGEFIDTRVPTGDSAFALMVRNGHLHGYSSKMNVTNPTTGWSEDLNFGLILTMGKLDADVLIYPRGAYDTQDGVKLDINLVAQSPGYWAAANSTNPATRATAAANWATNSHLMFANTATGVGVGILNNDVLWQTRDMYLRIGETDPTYTTMQTGLMLSSDTFARYYLRGLFGAGNLSNLGGSSTANVALWQFNLAANKYRFVMYPNTASYTVPDGSGGTMSRSLSTIGFEGFFDLDASSFLSLAEVSAPTASFNLYNVTGTLGWKDGNVVIKSGDQNEDGNPSITIENDLMIGESVNFGAGAGNPLIGNLGFGQGAIGQNYGRIAMPGGIWRSEIVAKVP